MTPRSFYFIRQSSFLIDKRGGELSDWASALPAGEVTDPPDGRGYIAIAGLTKSGYLRLPTDYIRAVTSAGGVPKVLSTFPAPPGEELPAGLEVISNIEPQDVSALDGDLTGLLLPGGGDVAPELYGRERHERTYNVSAQRDRFEMGLLEWALARDLPVFAVCRGFQLLNVALGGTLDQHLADDPHRLDHDRGEVGPDYTHKVDIKGQSSMAEILGTETIAVNSHHHQGLDQVADDLEPVAWAEDGVLEGVVSRKHPWVIGVQWHPEAMTALDPLQVNLFKAFVDAAARERD